MKNQEIRDWLATKTMSEISRKGAKPCIVAPDCLVLAQPSPFIIVLSKCDGIYRLNVGNFLGGSSPGPAPFSVEEIAELVVQSGDQQLVARAASELEWHDLEAALRNVPVSDGAKQLNPWVVLKMVASRNRNQPL